jgi:hypothetical protein
MPAVRVCGGYARADLTSVTSILGVAVVVRTGLAGPCLHPHWSPDPVAPPDGLAAGGYPHADLSSPTPIMGANGADLRAAERWPRPAEVVGGRFRPPSNDENAPTPAIRGVRRRPAIRPFADIRDGVLHF